MYWSLAIEVNVHLVNVTLQMPSSPTENTELSSFIKALTCSLWWQVNPDKSVFFRTFYWCWWSQSLSLFSDVDFSLICNTLIVDGFCLLMLLSVFAITSKGTIDDTYSRCPMVNFFLRVISWLVLLIAENQK